MANKDKKSISEKAQSLLWLGNTCSVLLLRYVWLEIWFLFYLLMVLKYI